MELDGSVPPRATSETLHGQIHMHVVRSPASATPRNQLSRARHNDNGPVPEADEAVRSTQPQTGPFDDLVSCQVIFRLRWGQESGPLTPGHEDDDPAPSACCHPPYPPKSLAHGPLRLSATCSVCRLCRHCPNPWPRCLWAWRFSMHVCRSLVPGLLLATCSAQAREEYHGFRLGHSVQADQCPSIEPCGTSLPASAVQGPDRWCRVSGPA